MILSMPFDTLSERLGGSGKAKIIWESLKKGIDPLVHDGEDGLSTKAKGILTTILEGQSLIPTTVITETLSDCGTLKLLQKLDADNLHVESVLIPSVKFDRTTLCVSTQIGCDRGCAFCLTGKMGLIRNLTSSEIIAQVIRGLQVSIRENMPPMTNIVFMGMGDSARNIVNVGEAVHALTDRKKMSMAAAKITISTVGPNPESFMTLASYPGTLAWSLHSPDDAIRKKLVPSTKHTTIELRDGLLRALETRTALRTRTIMIALTLIDGINDSIEDARKLAEFIKPMNEIAPKIAIDLIPYNDISVPEFRRPSREKINEYQSYLRDNGIFCSVRVTRGDEESSACGMLATERIKLTKSIDKAII
jgi:23S rRNA (adenine2503-C2)-methyltransferase